MIAFSQTQNGASLLEITPVTGLQTHSGCKTFSARLQKKLGLAVISGKIVGRGQVYRIGALGKRPGASVCMPSRSS